MSNEQDFERSSLGTSEPGKKKFIPGRKYAGTLWLLLWYPECKIIWGSPTHLPTINPPRATLLNGGVKWPPQTSTGRETKLL